MGCTFVGFYWNRIDVEYHHVTIWFKWGIKSVTLGFVVLIVHEKI